jgi:hypothetical protein
MLYSKHKFQSVGKRNTPWRSVLPVSGFKCVCPVSGSKARVNFEPAGITLVQNTGLWVRNMDAWVHSSMEGLFLFWRDFKEIFPILLIIGVFVIFPVIYVMFKRRIKKRGEETKEV